MNQHFPVINKRGTVASSLFMLINIILFSICLANLLSGGSKLWILPIIIFVVLFIISMMILISVLNAGIDIKDGTVILPDLDPSKGKQPKFHIDELKDVQLHDDEGNCLDPHTDKLMGARFAFLLENGTIEIYYPVAITARQYERIKNGMLEGLPH